MELIKKLVPLMIAVVLMAVSLPFIACMPDVVVEPPDLSLDYYEPDRPGSSPSEWGSTDPNMEWNPVKPRVTYENPTPPKFAFDTDINELRRRIRISEKAFKELKEGGGSGSHGFGTGCFAPETDILMADGSKKRIGDVTAGERVKGYDLMKKTFVEANVIEVYRVKRDSYFLVNNVKVTAEHPFYTERIWSKAHTGGEKSFGDEWVETRDLNVGSRLFGGVLVRRIESVDEGGLFINLTVDGVNNFFVVDGNGDCYLVHNKEVKF